MVDPYLGGYNSDQATILVVSFKPMVEISESISPRWSKHNFKEMVKDMQEMLLTGGVRTNIFRQGTDQIVVVFNDWESLSQAKTFFEDLDEVESVKVGED